MRSSPLFRAVMRFFVGDPPQTGAARAAAPRSRPVRLGVRRIAIVEDNAFQRDILESMVTLAGYECQVYAGPLDALAGINDDGADLLITDVFMPHMDGFTLADRVRKFVPDIRCVLVTSHDQDEISMEQQKSVEANGYALLHKPVTARKLSDTIARVA